MGVKWESGEIVVATPEKILPTRSVRRIPVEERWGKDCLDWVKWAPWKWHAGVEDEGDLPEGIPAEERLAGGSSGNKVIFVDVREKQSQDFSITKKDVENHRPTRGCAGCSSMFRNMGRRPHSAQCRERFRELLRNEARVQHNEAKRKELEQRELAKKERKI